VKIFSGRISPTTVIASTALFVSLGGVSYGVATGSIDSREIKNNAVRSNDIRNGTVRGGDVRNNSITGADVLESGLGKVPSASSADTAISATNAGSANSAQSANNANQVDGFSVAKIFYRAPLGSAPTPIVSGGGLTINADCGAPGNTIHLTAQSGKDDSSIYSFVASSSAPASYGNAEGGVFESGQEFDLLVGDAGNSSIVQFEFENPDGTVIGGTIATDSGNVAPPSALCVATGRVLIG